MGVGTILECRRCVLLATGASKADVIAKAVEGPITSMISATALQLHPRCTVIVDEEAATNLAEKDYYRWIFANEPEWEDTADPPTPSRPLHPSRPLRPGAPEGYGAPAAECSPAVGRPGRGRSSKARVIELQLLQVHNEVARAEMHVLGQRHFHRDGREVAQSSARPHPRS